MWERSVPNSYNSRGLRLLVFQRCVFVRVPLRRPLSIALFLFGFACSSNSFRFRCLIFLYLLSVFLLHRPDDIGLYNNYQTSGFRAKQGVSFTNVYASHTLTAFAFAAQVCYCSTLSVAWLYLHHEAVPGHRLVYFNLHDQLY